MATQLSVSPSSRPKFLIPVSCLSELACFKTYFFGNNLNRLLPRSYGTGLVLSLFFVVVCQRANGIFILTYGSIVIFELTEVNAILLGAFNMNQFVVCCACLFGISIKSKIYLILLARIDFEYALLS